MARLFRKMDFQEVQKERFLPVLETSLPKDSVHPGHLAQCSEEAALALLKPTAVRGRR